MHVIMGILQNSLIRNILLGNLYLIRENIFHFVVSCGNHIREIGFRWEIFIFGILKFHFCNNSRRKICLYYFMLIYINSLRLVEKKEISC